MNRKEQRDFMPYGRFRFNPKKHTHYRGWGRVNEPINNYKIHNPLLNLIKRFCLGKMQIKRDLFYCLDFSVNITEFYHPYLAHFDWICRAYNLDHQFLTDWNQTLVNARAKLYVREPQSINQDDF